MGSKKQITLDIGGRDYAFNMSIELYNLFINQTTPEKKTAPAENLARAALADKSQLDELNALLAQGLALDIVGALPEEFRPHVEITVKK